MGKKNSKASKALSKANDSLKSNVETKAPEAPIRKLPETLQNAIKNIPFQLKTIPCQVARKVGMEGLSDCTIARNLGVAGLSDTYKLLSKDVREQDKEEIENPCCSKSLYPIKFTWNIVCDLPGEEQSTPICTCHDTFDSVDEAATSARAWLSEWCGDNKELCHINIQPVE